MAKSPPRVYAWTGWFLLFVSLILLLVGVSGVQHNCGSAGANVITTGGGIGYFAPISCDRFFGMTWWITAYIFVLTGVIPVVLGAGQVHRWRYGLIGLTVVGCYLLMVTANSYHLLYKVTGSNFNAYAKTIMSGSIIGSVASFGLIALFGIREESAKSTS